MSQGQDWLEGANPPPRNSGGMGTGMKVFLGLLAGGGVLALLCCGGLMFFGYTAAKSMQPTQVPAEVEARTQEMVTVAVPKRFTPQMAIKFEMFGQKFATSNYTTATGDGHFGVVEISMPFAQAKLNGDDFAKQQAQNMRNAQQPGGPAMGGGPKDVQVDDAETKTEERDIRGQKCPVTITKGTQPGTDKVFRQLSVVMPGSNPNSSVIVQLQLPEADWDDAEIEALLDSLK